jgi:hypothetical protein
LIEEKYNWDRIAEQTIEVYEKVLKLRPRWNFPGGTLFHGVKIEGPQITQITQIR